MKMYQMKFLDGGFQKLEHEQDRQTDATERITRPHWWVITTQECLECLSVEACDVAVHVYVCM